MKFGQKIKTDIYSEWRNYYLDYNKLKKVLKEGTVYSTWNAQREKQFLELLENELEKIQGFQQSKASELARRIKEAENEVRHLVDDYDADSEPEDHDRDIERNHDHAGDGGSDDDDEVLRGDESDTESIDAVEERWNELEEQVAILVADVHDLALYTKLNFTGFIKIVKAETRCTRFNTDTDYTLMVSQKQTRLSLKATFIHDYLDKRPFYKYNWDSIIVKLSRLYDLVRTRGHPVEGDASAGGSQSAFVRQTTKYWVHPDNLVQLKLNILRYLPVLVFNPNKEFEFSDSAITSIYFDNEDLELYLGRVEKTEGAEAIRLRWYGGMGVNTIFVERKTHREDWTGEKSVKARFPIKEDKVNAFLKGEYTMDAEFEAVFQKGKKTRQEVDSMIQLAQEVQYTILARKLKPVMRTFYNRTAFQLPGDARVRISLDTELTMVREDNWDSKSRSGENWRRVDIGINHPFDRLPPEDKHLFPYGVLEVKLQTQLGQEPPLWVRQLVSSHIVESVPKFSKFIHGCASLLPTRVDLIPFWLPQMETDIRKPDTGNVSISRPTPATPHTNTDSTTTPELHSPLALGQHYTEPVSEGEDDEAMAIAMPKSENDAARVPLAAALEAIAWREQQRREQEVEVEKRRTEGRLNSNEGLPEDGQEAHESTPFLRRGPPKPRESSKGTKSLSIDPLAPSVEFDRRFKKKLGRRGRGSRSISRDPSAERREEEDGAASAEASSRNQGGETIYTNAFSAQAGKRIAVPVRVEPKVFFAQERTFLKWLHFGVLLGTVATTLLNFTKPGDRDAIICAGAFAVVSLLALAYAAGIFVHRALKLRKHDADALYYDPYGPTILSIAVMAAVIVNLVFQWGSDT